MSWQAQLRADPLPWLLDADAPGVRYLALRDLLGLAPDDPQLAAARCAAHKAGPIATILAQMDAAGFWAEQGDAGAGQVARRPTDTSHGAGHLRNPSALPTRGGARASQPPKLG